MIDPFRFTPTRLLLPGLLVSAACLAGSCAPAPDYMDPDLPVERRVDDLVGRMTLEEKMSQTLDRAPAIERLGIPEYNWWNEALHGVARTGLATVFPQAIGLAATWNDSLILRMATVISDEARAKHHEYVRRGQRLRYQGLTIWSPNINIFRDPRWGRGQETYGEDPLLAGRLAVQFVRGLQGDDPHYLKTVATLKHFAVHSGPEPERHTFDAIVGERDFRETYLPHFKRGIKQGGAYSVMCAYNRVAGEAACASDLLLGDILRGEWGFDGYVTSDCGALDDIYKTHRLVDTPAEAAAMGARGGTDLDCGSHVFRSLTEAVATGLIGEDVVDTAVRRLMTARMRLGMFDPPDRVPYAQIPYDVVDSPAHRELAREVARSSMVLLKNDGVLPLRKDLGTLAVIGPNADQWLMLLGNYNGVPSDVVTPLRGIREAVAPGTRVLYAQGGDLADEFPMFKTVPAEAFVTPDGRPGLFAEYFDSGDRTGEPLFSRVEKQLDANWHDGAPESDMDDDDFGVRWTATIRPPLDGTYRIGTIATMRFEVYFQDSLLVEPVPWGPKDPTETRVTAGPPMVLSEDSTYTLRVEAAEEVGDAQFQLVWDAPHEDLEAEAVDLAAEADAVVLFLGLTPRLEGEEMPIRIKGFRGGDRTRLGLPASQERLMERITALGKPTVLVLLNGSALAVNRADETVPAILEAWYPGQAAGAAIADVLFGDYNPAGRLPVTFYRSVDDLPPFEDYDMTGRTYRFFGGEPLYPFGHGLSYTTFDYTNLRTGGDTLSAARTLPVLVDVTNSGDRAGEEVVQLYVRYPASSVSRPLRELKDFVRVPLDRDETKTVQLTLQADDLRYWDADGDRWVLEAGPVQLLVGASSADIRLERTVEVAP